MTKACDIVVRLGNQVECTQSVLGCTKLCPLHPDHERFEADYLSRPPIYERREVGEGMEKDYE